MRPRHSSIEYRTSPRIADAELNRFFASAWDAHRERSFATVLSRGLAYLCAFDGDRLVGFVNIAWDGGAHGFILDTTVAPAYRRRGIGTELVRRAARIAGEAGLQWLHVDYEPNLRDFYRGCGFRATEAGLIRLSPASA